MTLYDLLVQANTIQTILNDCHIPLKVNDMDVDFILELRMDKNCNPECNLIVE